MKYDKQKGFRIKSHYFMWVNISTYPNPYWWHRTNESGTEGRWVHNDEDILNFYGMSTSCAFRVKSERAFRRRLKQWKYQLPK